MIISNLRFILSKDILIFSKKIELDLENTYAFLSQKFQAKLKKKLIIENIQSFLSMEKNEISSIKIKKIIANLPVECSKEQIKEIQNVIRVYRFITHCDPLSVKNFKQAHDLLMRGFSEHSGAWRKEQVIVYQGKKIAYIPPSPSKIPKLMKELFKFNKEHHTLSWLIKACIFHYAIQFIHPFMDGNGRMGRIWQHVLLLKQSPLFHAILISQLIKKNYVAYYKALDKSDRSQNGAIFIEFCLQNIAKELKILKNKKFLVK